VSCHVQHNYDILADIILPIIEFEAVRIGSPDHVPLIVVQWETIIAVNYPARKYGIKRYV
jgi:DNA polymerase eta